MFALAPSGPPVGFVGSARSPSEIITQWQPPLEEHRNGQILGYVIRYRLYGYMESPWTSRNITNEVQYLSSQIRSKSIVFAVKEFDEII